MKKTSQGKEDPCCSVAANRPQTPKEAFLRKKEEEGGRKKITSCGPAYQARTSSGMVQNKAGS
jgi:hypothetical protein